MKKVDLLKETKLIAETVDYYKNAKILKLDDKEVIERAANDYCDACDNNDEIGKNKYMAVLMMKFWYQMANMHNKCKSVTLLEYEDYYDRLYYCINTACEPQLRAWRRLEANGKAKYNAQQCINQTIGSRGAAEILYQSNLDKAKANINTASLDSPINGGDSDDKETTLADVIAAEEKPIGSGGVEEIVQMYVQNGKLVEAIIIDNMAFGETTRTVKASETYTDFEGNEVKVSRNYSEFWAFKLVKLLNSLDDDYCDRFVQKYGVKAPELAAAMQAIRKANNQKLYKQVDSCRAGLAQQLASGRIVL